jgi:hypothetical protein
MDENMAQSTELKKIINDILGENVSKMLLNKMHFMLDSEQEDVPSLKQTCCKIEQMVGLFHGPDKAKLLGQRFKDSFSRAGFPGA